MTKHITTISLLFLLVFCGCSQDGMVSVSGTVTLDGKPLTDGVIMFLPTGTEGNTASTTITNGKYSVRVSPATMLVRIIAERLYTEDEIKELRANPMFNNDPMFNPNNMKKQYLPEIYNERTAIKEDIKENTKNLNFDLKSDGT
jgi:hypothetical protein